MSSEFLAGKMKKQTSSEVLTVPFPHRPEMPPTTELWVHDIRSLADQATAAVLQARTSRDTAAQTAVQAKRHTTLQASMVDQAAKQQVITVKKAAKRSEDRAKMLTAEMRVLLEVREKVQQRLDRVQKPLKVLQRRLDHRTQKVPELGSSEIVCTAVETDMRVAQETIQVSVKNLTGVCVEIEQHLKHMNDLRMGLEQDIQQSVNAKKVDAEFDHLRSEQRKVRKMMGGDSDIDEEELPKIVKDISLNKTPRTARVPMPPPSTSSTPRQQRSHHQQQQQRQNNPALVVDTARLLGLTEAAVQHSTLLRQRAHSTMKQLDQAVASSSDLVEKSVKNKINDTQALKSILENRLELVRSEMAKIEQSREKLRREIESDVPLLHSSKQKVDARKVAQKIVRDVNVNDLIAEQAKKEVTERQKADSARRQQLHALDQQHAQLSHVAKQLETAMHTKEALLAVDRRILEMGFTPSVAPGSRLSVTGPAAGSTGNHHVHGDGVHGMFTPLGSSSSRISLTPLQQGLRYKPSLDVPPLIGV